MTQRNKVKAAILRSIQNNSYFHDPMLENPQTIVKVENVTAPGFVENTEQLPDAIYIPFLNRYDNLNELLSSLSWFKRKIIVLVSNENDTVKKIDTTKNYQVSFINCSKYEATSKIKNLKTFQLEKFHHEIEDWDLPVKRNFALLHAIQNKFEHILLIDDDIEGISKKICNKGIAALESNNISGCLVEGFADTSVIGHIEQKYGEPYFPFLSGNFLFINPSKAESFFPLIYNEDWLFMVPSINQNKVSAVDVIFQKSYDPFDDICRIKLQEFGEVIAEGIFELISQSRFEDRYSEQFWNEYLNYRKSYVEELLLQADKKYVPFIKESLMISEKIKAIHCIEFIRDWEEDILTFKKIISNAA